MLRKEIETDMYTKIETEIEMAIGINIETRRDWKQKDGESEREKDTD